ncbi:response regulator [Thiothrix nivea]|uniref:Two component transcriptional regulator, winged helix family n=1 Tax=Thiothrix nivea (strain ATCC 35100 / DSM 5205 / JP2) TaxID=870187 RepID=A0A656HC61_THINJ|nr:response regulator [Thiothrix nivea]EIJ34458.1 two component transcriptional regulator, winged helix family [Thiothrix nivea DSM 5205]
MPANNTPVLLLVEDDARLAALMQEYLQQEGFHVTVEARGDTAANRIPAEQPDLVVLDVMLPGLDGMSVCRQVRTAYDNPILMLTARDEDIDQVLGLELGADDYVVKPVKPRVLLARIQNLLRRQEKLLAQTGQRLCFGDLSIDLQSRDATLAGEPLVLTTQEFDLLYLLASQAGTILNRDAILNGLSGIDYDGLDRSVDIRIARLRKRLGDNPAQPRYIKTVRNQGYLFLT